MTGIGLEDELLKVLDALALCPEPLFAINERNRIVFWNKPLQRLLGWSFDDVAGKTCGTVLAGNDPFGNRYCCDVCPVIAIAQRGDSVRQFGLTYRTKSDDYVPVDIAVLKFALPATKGVVLAHIVQTARNHVQHIFEKLEVHSKAEAVAFAYRMRVVS
jgi:PAS domain-containing protein